MRRPLIATAVLALALPLLAACGSDGTSATEPGPADCPATAGVPAFPGTWGTGPTIPAGKGAAPTVLAQADCRVGTGDTVTDTGTAYAWNYTGSLFKNGEVFDSSFTRGEPIDFSLDQVIPGWTEGLQGMKVGGRRLLVIPADQAYGAQGSPPAIGPNEPLVFVVDLVGPAAAPAQ